MSTNNKDKESIIKIKNIYSRVINYLNEKTASNYNVKTQGTRRCIKARVNEGFVFNDFVKVIDSKVDEWATDEKMCQFLRPQTLFGTKFESYLQNAQPKNVKNLLEED